MAERKINSLEFSSNFWKMENEQSAMNRSNIAEEARILDTHRRKQAGGSGRQVGTAGARGGWESWRWVSE